MPLNDTIATFVEDTATAHDIVHGDASTTVETDSGPVRSLAKLVADNQAVIDAQLPHFEAIADGTSPDAGDPSTWTGNESFPVSRGFGLLQSVTGKLAAFVISTFTGFLQLGTGSVARTTQSKLAESVTVLDKGALPNGTGDQSAAINNAFTALAHFPTSAPGGTVRLPPGVYAISAPIIVPFGFSLEGSGSDIYTSQILVNSNFVGAAAIIVEDSNASYVNAHVRNLGIDTSGLSGVEGITFYGAYHNSSIENIVVRNVAGNAAGVHVLPQAGMSVCESFLLRDIYVFKATGAISTVAGVMLDTVQESTLINVKSFHGANPGPSGGFACIHLRDCRGISIVGGASVSGDNAIYIQALNRNVVGITWINPTYENIAVANVLIRGNTASGFTVANVTLPQSRIEAPVATNFADVDNVAFLDIDLGNGNALAGAGVNNTVFRGNGAGTVTPTTGAQYTQLFYGSQTRSTYQVYPALEINGVSGPVLYFSNAGWTGRYSISWSANTAQDFGLRATDRNGNLIFNHSTAGQLLTWSQANAFTKPTQAASYTVANLPVVSGGAWLAYATNGRNSGEAAGSGTGCFVSTKPGSNTWCAIWSGVAVTS